MACFQSLRRCASQPFLGTVLTSPCHPCARISLYLRCGERCIVSCPGRHGGREISRPGSGRVDATWRSGFWSTQSRPDLGSSGPSRSGDARGFSANGRDVLAEWVMGADALHAVMHICHNIHVHVRLHSSNATIVRLAARLAPHSPTGQAPGPLALPAGGCLATAGSTWRPTSSSAVVTYEKLFDGRPPF